MDIDVIIVGSGLSGVITALEIDKNKNIALITKKSLEDCNSYLAQGGICMLKDTYDREVFIEDTLRAGHYKNDRRSVEILVDESQDAISSLLDYGVEFTKVNGEFHFTKEGGHSTNRILHVDDATGKYIMIKLIDEVKKRDNIHIFENTDVHDLILSKNKCIGFRTGNKDFYSPVNVLATGGLGGIFEHSTNYSHIRGDGVAMAIRHGVKLKDISYIQIHPTTLFEEYDDRRFLISEAVRGEGAIILNHENKRFVNELLPRDIVSKEIFKEMERENVAYEYLSMKEIGRDEIKNRFPTIFEKLLEIGVDPRVSNVKIVPSEHYTMGGIEVDYNGRTSLDGLFAVGEVANTGVHGQNRLASNSLLESVVYGKRLAKYISGHKFESIDKSIAEYSAIYSENENKRIIFERIEEDARIKEYVN